MQKTELEAALAQKLEISKAAARDLLNVILDQITLEMSRGHRVRRVRAQRVHVRRCVPLPLPRGIDNPGRIDPRPPPTWIPARPAP